MPQSWDMGQILSLPLRRKAGRGFFRCQIIQRLRSGLNPRTRVPEASMLTTRPPKPSRYYHKYTYIFTQSTLYNCEILKDLEFSPRFSKKAQISTCMKINLVAAELHTAWKTGRRTDRQTGRQKSLSC
jgi:hypothetical protein